MILSTRWDTQSRHCELVEAYISFGRSRTAEVPYLRTYLPRCVFVRTTCAYEGTYQKSSGSCVDGCDLFVSGSPDRRARWTSHASRVQVATA
jgi:hypothetical protein